MGTAMRRRMYSLDAGMVRAARKVLQARTDTEAIQRALRKAVEDRRIERTLDRLLREGRFRTVYR